MSNRRKQLIGVFIMLAISLALFAVVILAYVNYEPEDSLEITTTEEVQEEVTTVVTTETAVPPVAVPRPPTTTAQGPSFSDFNLTETPAMTPTTTVYQTTATPYKRPLRSDRPNRCPKWMAFLGLCE